VLDARGTGVPVVLHWGADLGASDLEALADVLVPAIGPSSIDAAFRPSILPLLDEGWSGRQALVTLPGQARLRLAGVDAGERSIRVSLAGGGLAIEVRFALSAEGVLRESLTVTNVGGTHHTLLSVDATLPLPARATELLDFTGRWPRERQPQRRAITQGTWVRDSRHGRPGHDSAYLMVAGTAGFGFRSGEVWAAHVAFSGDQSLFTDATAMGHTLLGGGELLAPGEVRLAAGQSYTSPDVVFTWSNSGLDGIAARLHSSVRSTRRLGPRKVMLNTWEAVYFDHDLATLTRLADAAADVGVERFVLDDGWFLGRTDDRRALGDWTVDPVKWPQGLHPLIDHVRSRGMDFGLWVEPEMVSADSEVARSHPEWVVDAGGLSWRFQHVLDLANPAAFAHVHGQLRALLLEYPIAYLKWDQNRDLLVGSAHEQTLATYRLMDALRTEFPGLEIESCSSGGARVDLGVIDRVDRVWPSDTNDALERQAIYRWSVGVVPPEFLGVHLGAGTAHTTGRTHELGFRLATALFGHAGIEWDLTRATPEELAAVSTWISVYKRHRALLHAGAVVRLDPHDASRSVHGVVAPDAASALFTVVQLSASDTAVPRPTTFAGLDAARSYRVTVVDVGAPARVIQDAPPPWFADGAVTLSGRALMEVGLPMPLLLPEQALVVEFSAI
jgi:alpha-galactosidase